jgi:hypothetical protein
VYTLEHHFAGRKIEYLVKDHFEESPERAQYQLGFSDSKPNHFLQAQEERISWMVGKHPHSRDKGYRRDFSCRVKMSVEALTRLTPAADESEASLRQRLVDTY